VFVVVVKVIRILGDAVVAPDGRQHRVFIPLRYPVACRVGERPLRKVMVRGFDMRADQSPGVAVLIIALFMRAADTDKLPGIIPGVVPVQLRFVKMVTRS
jgi:hypothetical protein